MSREKINCIMRVVCIFIDGIGLGGDDPRANPFLHQPTRIFPPSLTQLRPPIFNGIVIPTDACLGVSGLPQSATGQASLFSGVNAAALLGRHRSGFATPSLIELLARESIFVKALQRGYTAAFANAYGHEFFELPPPMRARFTSVTTAATETAGLPFFRVEAILNGDSLYHDFTNAALQRRGYDYPLFSPEFAGKQLAALAQAYDFCLYEYFLSDKIGHTGNFPQAVAEVEKLDRFVAAVLEQTDLTATLVVVCSDHGNLEDMRSILHTSNPVPTLLWGPLSPERAASIHALTDLTPFMLRCLTE